LNVGSKPFGVRIATRRKFNRKRINVYNVTVPNFGGFLCRVSEGVTLST